MPYPPQADLVPPRWDFFCVLSISFLFFNFVLMLLRGLDTSTFRYYSILPTRTNKKTNMKTFH